MMLGKYSEEDGKKLLKLARESIEEEFSSQKPEELEGKEFRQARGAFVTLTKKGKLRGCIGFPDAIFSVYEAVYKAAKAAAFSDPRFPPLKQDELNEIKIEISILTPASKCNISDIKVGVDGLICQCIGYSGLLLPQVAKENRMNKIEFVEAVCQKAGLPKDAWQRKDFRLSSFQAQVFSE